MKGEILKKYTQIVNDPLKCYVKICSRAVLFSAILRYVIALYTMKLNGLLKIHF